MEAEAGGKGMEELGQPGERVALTRVGEKPGKVDRMGDSGTRASCRVDLCLLRLKVGTAHHGSFPLFQHMATSVSASPAAESAAVPLKDRWTHPPGVRLVRATSHLRPDPSEVWWVELYRSGRHSDGRSQPCNEERQRHPTLSDE